MATVAAFDLHSALTSQPQLLVVLFAGAVWLFKMIARARSAVSRRELGPQEATQPAVSGRGGASGQDPGEEERTRRVREEIIRKVAERRTTASAAQLARFSDPRRGASPPVIAATASSAGREAAQAGAAMPSGGPPIAAPSIPPAAGVPIPSAGALWLDELRARDAVRRSILVREILGPPVALR